MPCFSRIISEMLPEIHTVAKVDLLESIIHSQVIIFSVIFRLHLRKESLSLRLQLLYKELFEFALMHNIQTRQYLITTCIFYHFIFYISILSYRIILRKTVTRHTHL